MATHPIHEQIRAVEAAAATSATGGGKVLEAAAETLREVERQLALYGRNADCFDGDRLARAAEGLRP